MPQSPIGYRQSGFVGASLQNIIRGACAAADSVQRETREVSKGEIGDPHSECWIKNNQMVLSPNALKKQIRKGRSLH